MTGRASSHLSGSSQMALIAEKAVVASELERVYGCAAGAGGVSVGHDDYGDVGLFLALQGHAVADFFDEPALEIRAGFDGSSADNEGVGVEDVDHLIEEE